MKYRREIDGLRAVAVLPVILFHAGLPLFQGGFVGVDIFFVISGYLITTILIDDIEKGRFSLWTFYERRARRILPALFFVMAVSAIFAWMWMLPKQMADFGRSTLWVTFFASNILFNMQSGYFSASSDEKPLLHTWSLAVEEQYYLLFPVFLFLAWRFGKRPVFWMIVAMSAASLAYSEWLRPHDPTANFYLAPGRAWELFAGSLAAFIINRYGVRRNEVLAMAGLVIVIGANFLYTGQMPYPGLLTLVPVTGVVLLVLFATGDTYAGRFLSNRLFVGIGLISYSAYLWHQPVLAFARIRLIAPPELWVMVLLCVLTFGLAYLSWRFIEQPFRDRTAFTRNRIFTISGAGLAAFALFGLAVSTNEGYPSRMPADVMTALEVRLGDSTGCHNELDGAEIAAGQTCVAGADAAPTVAVIGDSHASRISDAMADALAAKGEAALLYNGSWCAPLMNFATLAAGRNKCLDRINAAYASVLDDPSVKDVVLYAEWANYTEGFRWNEWKVASYAFSPDGKLDYTSASAAENPERFAEAVDFTFAALAEAGKNVVIVLPTPEFKMNIRQAAARIRLYGEPVATVATTTRAEHDSRTGDARAALLAAADRYGFKVIDPAPLFCDDARCDFTDADGMPLFEDLNHVAYAGAERIADLVVPQLN